MADSSVDITAGSGTSIDTRTEGTNSNHRQVIVVGDPATNAGVAPVDATAGLKVDLGADNDVTVSGVSTSAKQDTIIGHLDGVEGLLTTIDSDTGGILTSVQTLDNAISGNEMQVDVVGALPAGTNNIGDVDVLSISAGENHIAQIGGHSEVVVTTPTIDTTPDYSAGDLVGDKLTINGIGRIASGSGVIVNVFLTSDVDTTATFDVLFFFDDPTGTTFTDNSALSLAVADLHFLIGAVSLDTIVDMGTPVMIKPSVPVSLPFTCDPGTDDIYAAIIARGTYNAAGSADLNLVVGVLQD